MINFNELVNIKEREISPGSIFFIGMGKPREYRIEKTRRLCQLPYPKIDENGKKLKKKSEITHKNGCPNYGKSKTCPPLCKYRDDILEKYQKFVIVYAEFDFKGYKELRKQEHPEWSGKQLSCLLYWQKSIQKMIRRHVEVNYKNDYDEIFFTGSGLGDEISSMEAAGINVFGTLKNNGIGFEVKPVNKVILVSLLMFKNKVKKVKKGKNLLDFFSTPVITNC